MDKWVKLQEILHAQGKVAIAFSGGVDSSLLLKLSVDSLGAENVLALTAISQLLAQREIAEARTIAGFCGARLVEVPVDALGIEEVSANPEDRCYHCKKAVFGALFAVARSHGFESLLDGSNASDRGDYRPGEAAAKELGAVSPFDMCDITKAEIREKSRSLGLPNSDAPAAACLASRIPYGTALTMDALRSIERAEDALIEMGFEGCRVRLHNRIARIEARADDIELLADQAVRKELLDRLKPLGFDYITLDLDGYRMGSLNKAIKDGNTSGS